MTKKKRYPHPHTNYKMRKSIIKYDSSSPANYDDEDDDDERELIRLSKWAVEK
jgi:hypothetical protein